MPTLHTIQLTELGRN